LHLAGVLPPGGGTPLHVARPRFSLLNCWNAGVEFEPKRILADC